MGGDARIGGGNSGYRKQMRQIPGLVELPVSPPTIQLV